MLTNSDGNVMKVTGFFINSISLITVNVTVYPDLTSYKNGLDAFQKTIGGNVNLPQSSTTSIKSTDGDSSLSIFDNVIDFIEGEIASASASSADNYSLNNQVNGTWKKS